MTSNYTGGWPSSWPNPLSGFQTIRDRAALEENNPEWSTGALGVPNIGSTRNDTGRSRLPIHPNSSWKPALATPKYNVQPDAEPMGPPITVRPSDNVLRATGSGIPALPAFDERPGQIAALEQSERRNAMQSALNPAIQKNAALINELENYGGGATGSALALGMLFNNVLPQQATLAQRHAELIGQQPYQGIKAYEMGNKNKQEGEYARFRETLPSVAGETKYRGALTDEAIAKTDWEKNRVGIERAKILAKMSGKRDIGSALNPGDLLKAQISLSKGEITPEQFNKFMQIGSMYKHPAPLGNAPTE